MYTHEESPIKTAIKQMVEIGLKALGQIENVELEAQEQQNRFRTISTQNDPFSAYHGETDISHEENEMAYYHSQGSVFQRSDGRFAAKIYDNGKYRQVAISKFKDNVIQKLNKAIQAKSTGLSKENPMLSYTLYSWLESWATTFKEGKVSKKYYEQIWICIRKHVKNNIQDRPLDACNGIIIQKGIDKIESSRMHEYTFNILAEAIKKAFALDLIPKNFMEAVEPYKHHRENRKAFTIEDEKLFIQNLENSPLKNYFLFELYTGCRPDEAFRMRWEFIDFKNEIVYIDGTKTELSKRKLPLFEHVKNVLENTPRTEEKIFPFSKQKIIDEFKRIMKICGFTQYSQYCLRHTFGTRLNEMGLDLKTISLWMGHSNTQTTERVYIESQDAHQQTLKLLVDTAYDTATRNPK